MIENMTQHSEEDSDSLFPPLTQPDLLDVLSSTWPVVEQGERVWINRAAFPQVLARLTETPPQAVVSNGPTWYAQYHFFDGTERTVNWLLLLDALNFCFWAEKDAPRWQITYQGETLNGYWAEAASLLRAVEEGMPLWDAQFLQTLNAKHLAQIFRGSTQTTPSIPLFKQRLEIIHETGRILQTEFDGQFTHAIERVQGSAPHLVLLLAQYFPSFRDTCVYRQQEVRFFKRAQICVADLFGAFGGKSWGALSDVDALTAFADYKVPQVLRHFGVLEYQPTLASRIDAQELLAPGSEEEIEIRAATIWACELLRRELHMLTNRPVTAIEIDNRLWHLGQHSAEMQPYHRTRTIYY